MSIKVQTNKNIVFFQLLLALIHDENSQLRHPLSEKIIERFKFVKEFSEYEDFVEIYSQKNIPQNEWDYLLFALYTTDKFVLPANTHIRDEYISKIYEIYKKEIYPKIKELYVESKFEIIYIEEFKPLYENICADIKREIELYNPEKILLKFWNLDPKTNLYLIPNLFRVGGGSGFPINGKFYAVIGASNCNGEVLFKPTNMISTIYHEFSHSFFKERISKDKELLKKNKEISKSLEEVILKKVRSDTGILQNYGTSTVYLEETYMRAIQIFLSYEFFKQIYSNSESLRMDTQKKLEAREMEGFIFIKEFFEQLGKSRNENPMKMYMNILKSLL